MHFAIKIAGIIVRIQTLYDSTYLLCKDYLVSENDAINPDVSITIHENLLREERHTLMTACKDNEHCSITYYNSRYIEKQLVHKMIAETMPFFGIFLMHGSVVSTDGYGYMFIAPSGVGKTTRTNVWLHEHPGSFIVSDDKPLLKVLNNDVFACGTPWCGKEKKNTNTMVPLRAIISVQRVSEGEKNTISELTMNEAFFILLRQSYMPSKPEAIKRTMNLIKAMDGKVKLFRLCSTPTPEAMRMAYEAVNK